MTNLLKDTRIYLDRVGVNQYEITDRNKDTLKNSDDNYFIYMKNVTFKRNGGISGIYLGENPQHIIDGYCREASFNQEDGWRLEDGAKIERARMVAVENKSRTIVVIQED